MDHLSRWSMLEISKEIIQYFFSFFSFFLPPPPYIDSDAQFFWACWDQRLHVTKDGVMRATIV